MGKKRIKLSEKKSCLKSLMKAYRINFNRLATDALEINLLIKEILKLEEVVKDG